jgi:osmotically-inducible protein OsmY
MARNRSDKSSWRRTTFVVAGSAAAGAVGAYLLDPAMGRSRRAQLSQRAGAVARRSARRAEQKARYAQGKAVGAAHNVAGAVAAEAPAANDQTLAEKIRSEVFGKAEYPKDKLTVSVEGGVASLRGEVLANDTIDRIEQDVRKVDGVVDVVNLLHLPGQPPPNKEAALRAQRS